MIQVGFGLAVRLQTKGSTLHNPIHCFHCSIAKLDLSLSLSRQIFLYFLIKCVRIMIKWLNSSFPNNLNFWDNR